MRGLVPGVGLIGLLLGGASQARAESPSPSTVRFNRDVRPIMADTCFKCHGPAKREGNLRLDVRDEALRPTDTGAIPIVPGKPDESELIRRVLSDDEDTQMPPPASHKTLTDQQKTLLSRWVEQGAAYEQHWSFEPLRQPEVPQITRAGYRILNPVDAFLAEQLHVRGLPMQPEAPKETLVRRVAFALTGLPPTIAEVDEFLADDSDAAYGKMVERYLQSQRFGEEMARHWLDVARYADTHGLHLDNERQMWAYRDWAIRAFNDNLPFDQFTIDQLAGDLVPGATLDQIVATGFNRCNVTTGEGGSIDDEWVFRNAVDRATTVAETWLGLTAGCCVCHDHKFDPLTAKDFYSFYAFFQSAADPPLDGNALLTAPTTRLDTPGHKRQLADLDQRMAAVRQKVDEQASAVVYTDPAEAAPRPTLERFEELWFDDQFPTTGKTSASPGQPTQLITKDQGPVFRGDKALRRTDAGLAQDVHEETSPLSIPPEGRLFAHVWIDSKNPPRTLMVQYFKGGWLHRGVWGDYDAIPWGAANTTEKVNLGPLPAADQWVRLEFDATQVGLQPGDQVTGFALTQFGGTVYWDSVGVSGNTDPAADPRQSLRAWWQQQLGKDVAGVTPELAAAIKAGPEQAVSSLVQQQLRNYYVQHVCRATTPLFEPLKGELSALVKQREDLENGVPSTFVFRDLEQPRESFVMLRGQYNQPGERVEPNTPAVLPPLSKPDPARRATRLDLAKWLVSRENPLTPRVAANRLWQQLFGTGLVKTSFDFGTQGEPPSHPELLDWLAVWFRDNQWDVKGLIRLMVTSAAFRQSSEAPPELWNRDPENRWCARGPRFRLDAEPLRDNALFVSGLINLEMGGRGTRSYQPPNIWEPVGFVGSNTHDYVQDHGAALYRRSIYAFLKRTAPPPFMANFDAPNREQFCSRRERSNTPLQALQLMNDTQYFEAARALGERLLTDGGTTPDERIVFAYRLVLARRPQPDELAIVRAALEKHQLKMQQHPEAAKQLIRVGESVPGSQWPETELAAYVLVANLLLNLDETVTRN